MLKQFPPARDFMALSLKDLLEARDAYHVHLSHLSNVVGTAVGRFRFREDDWYATHPPRVPLPKGYRKKGEYRTLFNSVVTEWSWPCVLVFVDQWLAFHKFSRSPDQMVPRALFLPDGRVIPTCVVCVEQGDATPPVLEDLSFPRSFVGGGYLTLSDVQGREHFGSVACLVTDGDLTYALTNRHVTGGGGREISTLLGGKRTRIGVADPLQLTSKPFAAMYPGWVGPNVELHLDAGLIRVDNIARWTTQVFGIGVLDELLDLTTDTLTLRFIDQPVRAFGAASGPLKGKIAALFYRYKSVGGIDYVTDFLIQPDTSIHPGTKHGDSGTLWFWEQPPVHTEPARLRPFAMQWGGQVFTDESGDNQRTGNFALATSLSTVCRELNVSLVRDWNTGLPEYWGDVGHYTIGFFACDRLTGKVHTMMKANQELIAYPTQDITSKTAIKKRGPNGFVRLADVPDRIWKVPKATGFRGGKENPNHFADMDRPLPDAPNKGKTLLQLCTNPDNVDPDFWIDYYTRVGDGTQGLLPFRVWQFFNEMVDAVAKRELDRFICCAGTLAHYVGDACQPLHISFMFNGEPSVDENGKPFKRGEGVHSAYESDMLTEHSLDLIQELSGQLKAHPTLPKSPTSGKEAAVATVRLMQRTFGAIKPIEIVDAFVQGQDLWNEFHVPTVKIIADGVRTLASIWRGAWKAGNGDAITPNKLVASDPDVLRGLYEPKTTIAPSHTLKEIKPFLS